MIDFVNKTLYEYPKRSQPDYTMKELNKAIQKLKSNKASGPDGIPSEILKCSSKELLEVILKLMNKIKTFHYYPCKWGLGRTSLILKDGNDDDPNNYRPITVNNTIAKILAILINERLTDWCDKNHIIRNEQIGFIKHCRPADHLFVLKTLIDTYTCHGKKIFACFVDFKKAFDSVWRTGLFYKLIANGVDLDMIRLIKDMYSKTKQTLNINNKITREFTAYRGVRQGCILSSIIFNIFINDIPTIFDSISSPVWLDNLNINCLMYADDLVLLSETKAGLQNSLNKLNIYTQQWNLEINLSKTKVIIFQNSGKQKMPSFKINNIKLEVTKRYKYLGTLITNTGNFKLNEVNLKRKGQRATFMINQQITNYSKPSTAITLFEKIIEPILTYNCEVTMAYIPPSWNYVKFVSQIWTHGQEINKVVSSFLRQVLGVHKKTSNIAVLSETGKYPIAMKVYTTLVKYWLRLKTTNNTLLKAALIANIKNQKSNKKSWLNIIDYLLRYTNISNTTLNVSNITHSKFIEGFKKQMKVNFSLWWKNQAITTGDSKLDFYYQHKQSFVFESYLDNIPKHIRLHITRLRMSCHNLPVEILRYKKDVLRHNRLCNVCNLKVCGDENHYLLQCSNHKIKDLRQQFIHDVTQNSSQLKHFSQKQIVEYCMSMKDENIQYPTAVYIKKLMGTYRKESKVPPLHILCDMVIHKRTHNTQHTFS